MGTVLEDILLNRTPTQPTVAPFSSGSLRRLNYDWHDAPEVSYFYGREEELVQVERWVQEDHCRLIAIVGLGGLGKTALAAKATRHLVDRQVATAFDQILWRSLLNAPPLEDLLPDILRFLAGPELIDIPAQLDQRLALLLEHLRQKRCLLILDNLESILESGPGAGAYRTGYEDYEQLLRQLGQYEHQSCVLLTSREIPQGLARLEGDIPRVRSLQLSGLPADAAHQLLVQQGLAGDKAHHTTLINRYSGHPLALKLVAETITDLYFGDVEAFLTEDTLIFADIRDVLDQHFARLSPLEQEIMTWLAIEREPVLVQTLGDNLLGPMPRRAYLEALRALQQRSLLEKQEEGFTLQNVIIEYTTERLIDHVCQELVEGILESFNRYALLKAQAKDYIRESQRRLILQPVGERLAATFGPVDLVHKLRGYLDRLREEMPQGYAGGNILNLLLHYKSALSGFDFSNIAVWQAYLQGKVLADVDLSRANLRAAVFFDTYGVLGAVTFSPDGKLLAVGTAEGQIRIWRTSDWQPVQTLQSSSYFTSICFSPDGHILASSGGIDRTVVRLWDVISGQVLHNLAGHTEVVQSVSFSPDGHTLASGSDDRTIRLWDVASGQALQTLEGHTNWVDSVCFSPDGRTLASGSADQTIQLWDMVDIRSSGRGHILWTLQGHTEEVQSVSFSPDGRTLASGSEDHTIRLWDVVSGQPLQTLQGHTGWIYSVYFSPDGHTLASASEDRTIRLWDVADVGSPGSGQVLQTLQGHTGGVTAVCFNPDGHTLPV